MEPKKEVKRSKEMDKIKQKIKIVRTKKINTSNQTKNMIEIKISTVSHQKVSLPQP